jgi:Holliday junction resolvase
VRRVLEDEGWWVARAAGSLGDADLVAGKEGKGRIVEVKATAAGPFHSFGPQERAELLAAAEKSGFEPILAYWPKRGELRWLAKEEWP